MLHRLGVNAVSSKSVLSPLARFTASIKATDKSNRNPAEKLLQIINDYTQTEQFDAYITRHAADVVRYLKPDIVRPGRWRASSAGSCLQEQAFRTVAREKAGRFSAGPAITQRKSETMRALANGTFMHIRWHLLFDALGELGYVETLFAEDLRYDKQTQLSGTVDRVIEFEFEGKPLRAIIDFKSMKSTYFDPLLEPTPSHEMQQMAYDLFGYDADCWMMLYECKNTHKLKIYARRYNPAQVQHVVDNLRKLNNWVDLVNVGAIDDQLPHLPLITDWCRYCHWSVPCKKLNPDRDGTVSH